MSTDSCDCRELPKEANACRPLTGLVPAEFRIPESGRAIKKPVTKNQEEKISKTHTQTRKHWKEQCLFICSSSFLNAAPFLTDLFLHQSLTHRLDRFTVLAFADLDLFASSDWSAFADVDSGL